MNKISCDICLDLIPLVKDGVASKASSKAVIEHLDECESCQEYFDMGSLEEPKMDDKRVISKMKREIYLAGLIALVFGSILGVALFDGIGMFYNILIMPTIGGLGYLLLRKKSYYVPLVLFAFAYIWVLIKSLADGMLSYAPFMSVLLQPLYWGVIYSGLSILGIFIGFLLYLAFKKEGKK